jgi:hypothetical protein
MRQGTTKRFLAVFRAAHIRKTALRARIAGHFLADDIHETQNCRRDERLSRSAAQKGQLEQEVIPGRNKCPILATGNRRF